jgi:ribosomal protein L11 methyltransferase
MPTVMHGCVTFRVAPDRAEALSCLLWTLPDVTGIEESPSSGTPAFSPDPRWEVIEFGTRAAADFQRWLRSERFRTGSSIALKLYVRVSTAAAWRAWQGKHLRAAPTDDAVICGAVLLRDRDYTASSRRRVKGRKIGRHLWVGPPWQQLPPDRTSVVIEPGMAFGSGDHPTTRWCLTALDRLARHSFPVTRLFDVGTGSGVLAIAAARLFPKADLWLCDLDPTCAEAVRRGFNQNRLARRRRHGFWGENALLETIPAPQQTFDVVLSNIYLESLEALTGPVADLVRPGGRWIVAGLLGTPQIRQFRHAVARRWSILRVHPNRSRSKQHNAPVWWGVELTPRERPQWTVTSFPHGGRHTPCACRPSGPRARA